MSTIDLQDALLTVSDVTRLLRLSRTTIYVLVKRRRLPAVRFGRTVRFRREDVHNYVRLHLSGAARGSRRRPSGSSQGKPARAESSENSSQLHSKHARPRATILRIHR